jgi:hypothetical protein
MTQLKTRANGDDVEAFLDSIADTVRQSDAREVCGLMANATRAPAVMWGSAIVGFGSRRLRYDDGREVDWMVIGFSPRKANTTLYLSGGVDRYADLFVKFGKHTTGKGCLYLKRLSDVDRDVLAEVISRSVAHATQG